MSTSSSLNLNFRLEDSRDRWYSSKLRNAQTRENDKPKCLWNGKQCREPIVWISPLTLVETKLYHDCQNKFPICTSSNQSFPDSSISSICNFLPKFIREGKWSPHHRYALLPRTSKSVFPWIWTRLLEMSKPLDSSRLIHKLMHRQAEVEARHWRVLDFDLLLWLLPPLCTCSQISLGWILYSVSLWWNEN